LFRNLLSNARLQTFIVMLLAVTILAGLVPGPALAQTAPDAGPQAPSAEEPGGVWIPGTEVVAMRTATTRTYLGDHPGQYVDKMYTQAVNFKQGADWKPIDSTLGSSTSGRRKNKANTFSVSVADRSDSASVGELALDSEHSVGFAIDGGASVSGRASKNEINYSKVKKNTDLKLTSMAAGLKEELILTSPDSPTRFVFPLKLQGLTAELEDSGDIVYRDADGKQRARTPRGIMYDSGTAGEPPALSDHVYYSLIPHGKGTALEVRIDEQWVRSPERTWPISVDPSFVASYSADDTFVLKNFPPYNFGSWHEVWVGSYWSDGIKYTADGYVHFGTNTLWGKNIDSAVLWAQESTLYGAHSYNCGSGLDPVAKVATDTWPANGLTTYPGPVTDPSFGSIAGQMYQGTCGTRSASWNITQIARHWATSGAGNGSVAIVGSGDITKFHPYKAAETGLGSGMYLSAAYTVDGSPFGTFDGVVEETPGFGDGPATLRVSGWMIDPNSTAPAQIVVKNAFAGMPQPAGDTFTANAYRPDVANNYPGYGPYHGFSVLVQSTGTPGPHQVCVVGKNTFGPGGDTALPCQNVSVVNKPGAPQVSASTTNGDGDVTVTWTPPASGGSPITTYDVKAINASGSQVGPTQSCNCTSKPFANLAAGTYRFEVVARNQAYPGSNGATGFVEYQVKRRPSAPNGVEAEGRPSSALITWTEGSSNGAPLTKYEFEATDTATGAPQPPTKICELSHGPCSGTDGFLYTGLTPLHTYTFRVRALNEKGWSDWSSPSPPEFIPDPTAPQAPRTPTATLEGDNVDVTWTAPAGDGGSDITGYKVRAHLATTDDAVGDQPLTCGATCSSIEFTGLTAGTGYKFKIYAVNSVGDSPAAVTSTVTIPEQEPDPTPEPSPSPTPSPSPSPSPEPADKFVYLALGDSYSSGEGAGNSFPFSDTQGYLSAYEPDSYRQGLHEEFPNELDPPGTSCHRALANYAKLNRDRLAPDQEVVLIDLTCSGAKAHDIYEPNNEQDQESQAEAQLSARGLSGENVDLVTIGVGGNDAGFTDIAFACILPSVLRKAVAAHPDPPLDVEAAVKFASCERVEDYLDLDSDLKIQGVKGKVKVLHTVLASVFPTARILQVDYPNILPTEAASPPYCGGVRSQDLEYARGRVVAINDQIRSAVSESQEVHSQIELVELQDSFGTNALCPQSGPRAVGIEEGAMDTEIRRLLNLDGNGDAIARQKIDKLIEEYRNDLDCSVVTPNFCDSEAFQQALDAALTYLRNQVVTILANMTESPQTGESAGDFLLRVDRSQGLFHPNLDGHAVQACRVLLKYGGTEQCA
jgi:hypothetical protein